MQLASGTVQEKYCNMHVCASMLVENGEKSLQDFFSRLNVHNWKMYMYKYLHTVHKQHASLAVHETIIPISFERYNSHN